MNGVYTTLKKLRDAGACTDRYAHLRSKLGNNYGDDTPINLVTILDHNGLDDVLWIPRKALSGDNIDCCYRLFAVACCQDILHLMEDERSKYAVKVAHLFAHGESTEEDLAAAREAAGSAAWGTSCNASWAAARVSASDASWFASRSAAGAAGDAAYAAAGKASAWVAAYAAQKEHFRRIFEDGK